MQIIRHGIALMLALGALLVPLRASAAPLINVTPQSGPVGTTFLFYASGFAINERFSIWLNGPGSGPQSATANETQRTTSGGAASFSWAAPAGTAPGAWQMVVHSLKSNFEQVIPFEIQSATNSPAQGDNVTPAAGRPGALFRFYVSGFAPREQVETSVAGPGGQLAAPDLRTTGHASDTGRVDGSWVAPGDAAAGTWSISFRGVASGTNRTLSVTISAAPARSPAQLTVSPASGTAGTPFLFSASGFAADETFSVWLNTPDGKVVPAQLDQADTDPQAGPNGNASWGWKAPQGTRAGTWQMVAHGRESGIEAVATFTLQ